MNYDMVKVMERRVLMVMKRGCNRKTHHWRHFASF